MIFMQRRQEFASLSKETKTNGIPVVSLIKGKAMEAQDEITLPGTILAWHESSIFARTQGYVKAWYVDIGSKVKKGDLLAQIETPELNEQLRQAEADLKVTIAQNKLAQSTAARWLFLRQSDAVSQQATDEKVDNAAAVEASVIAKKANRDRLVKLVEFERVSAPFDGIISDRRTDLGNLVNIGSQPSQEQALFRIVQINPLRLYVKIPQTYSSRIQSHMQVKLEFAEHPGQIFSASLLETAHAIDAKTRTLLTQFKVDNDKEVLLPGSYTSVHFSIPTFYQAVRLPINALIFRKEGMQIATVDKNNRIVLKNLTINRDFGNFVEVVSGVSVGEWVVINPSDSIYQGQKVRVSDLKSS